MSPARSFSETIFGPIHFSSHRTWGGGFGDIEIRVQGDKPEIWMAGVGGRIGWVRLTVEESRMIGADLLAAAEAKDQAVLNAAKGQG